MRALALVILALGVLSVQSDSPPTTSSVAPQDSPSSTSSGDQPSTTVSVLLNNREENLKTTKDEDSLLKEAKDALIHFLFKAKEAFQAIFGKFFESKSDNSTSSSSTPTAVITLKSHSFSLASSGGSPLRWSRCGCCCLLCFLASAPGASPSPRLAISLLLDPAIVCLVSSPPRKLSPSSAQVSFSFFPCKVTDSSVLVHGNAGTPTDLIAALSARADSDSSLHNVLVSHLILVGPVPWHEPRFKGKIRPHPLFLWSGSREAFADGRGNAMPIFLSEAGRLFSSGRLPVDFAFITVSPPDKHGFCSLGAAVECTSDALKYCRHIIAVVNPWMPRTFGGSLLHSSHIDTAVKARSPIFEGHLAAEADEASSTIGRLIAENLVDDGATIQLGIGNIPDAVFANLGHHKDIGVHTEVMGDGVVGLVESGVATGARKSVLPGRVVAAMSVGSRRLYDFLDDNVAFHFDSLSWTNNVDVVRAQSRMTAINSAIEVDLTGQVCADSIGTRLYSGFGGQVDFVFGASSATDGLGKAVIALPSRTHRGTPKIVPVLKEGSGVITTRGHVNFVVTEWGIAELWGKTFTQRAHALIQIAHPDDREQLEKAAFARFKRAPSPDLY